jgi:membrane protein YqaA with SNARE-associated domain
MMTWLIPYIFVATIAALYAFTPEKSRAEIRGRIRRQINFHLIAGIGLIGIAVLGSVFSRIAAMGWLAWACLVVVLVVCAARVLRGESPPPPEAF